MKKPSQYRKRHAKAMGRNKKPKGPKVKTGSKPASSSTTRPVSKLSTTASKPSTSTVKAPSGSPANSPERHQSEERDTTIRRFFSNPQYSRFKYDPARPIMEQYFEMRHLYRREWNQVQKDATWEGIRAALVTQFNSLYGMDCESLETWVGLATIIGITPVPDTLHECRDVRSAFS